MPILDKHSLKEKFSDGSKPTGDDFSNLIDSIQAGIPTEGSSTPVSNQVAIEGTDTTGYVSPQGLTSFLGARIATDAEAQSGILTSNPKKLMTPWLTKRAIQAQVSTMITAAKNTILGGVSYSYSTLKRLYDYLVYNYYTKTVSDSRYYRTSSILEGSQLRNTSVTSGKLSGPINGNLIQYRTIEGDKFKTSTYAKIYLPPQFIFSGDPPFTPVTGYASVTAARHYGSGDLTLTARDIDFQVYSTTTGLPYRFTSGEVVYSVMVLWNIGTYTAIIEGTLAKCPYANFYFSGTRRRAGVSTSSSSNTEITGSGYGYDNCQLSNAFVGLSVNSTSSPNLSIYLRSKAERLTGSLYIKCAITYTYTHIERTHGPNPYFTTVNATQTSSVVLNKQF